MAPHIRAGGFADHFSGVATGYAAHRPTYPEALYDWIAKEAPARGRVWDCATGTGQTVSGLVGRFREVVATDASVAQLGAGSQWASVRRVAATAEASSLRTRSVDAVTVGQALHWFDLEAFAREVARVARPGALVAAWTYPLLETEGPVRDVVHGLHGRLAAYWPTQRRHVDVGYADLDLPLAPVAAPELAVSRQWDLAALVGYLGTWSATARYWRAEGRDALDDVEEALRAAWPDPLETKLVRWRLVVRAWRVPSSV